jgi:hypothetical protein
MRKGFALSVSQIVGKKRMEAVRILSQMGLNISPADEETTRAHRFEDPSSVPDRKNPPQESGQKNSLAEQSEDEVGQTLTELPNRVNLEESEQDQNDEAPEDVVDGSKRDMNADEEDPGDGSDTGNHQQSIDEEEEGKEEEVAKEEEEDFQDEANKLHRQSQHDMMGCLVEAHDGNNCFYPAQYIKNLEPGGRVLIRWLTNDVKAIIPRTHTRPMGSGRGRRSRHKPDRLAYLKVEKMEKETQATVKPHRVKKAKVEIESVEPVETEESKVNSNIRQRESINEEPGVDVPSRMAYCRRRAQSEISEESQGNQSSIVIDGDSDSDREFKSPPFLLKDLPMGTLIEAKDGRKPISSYPARVIRHLADDKLEIKWLTNDLKGVIHVTRVRCKLLDDGQPCGRSKRSRQQTKRFGDLPSKGKAYIAPGNLSPKDESLVRGKKRAAKRSQQDDLFSSTQHPRQAPDRVHATIVTKRRRRDQVTRTPATYNSEITFDYPEVNDNQPSDRFGVKHVVVSNIDFVGKYNRESTGARDSVAHEDGSHSIGLNAKEPLFQNQEVDSSDICLASRTKFFMNWTAETTTKNKSTLSASPQDVDPEDSRLTRRSDDNVQLSQSFDGFEHE